MTKIRINPDKLEKTAIKLTELCGELSSMSSQVIQLGRSAPSYENQFRSEVETFASDTKIKIDNCMAELDHSSERLVSIARQFQNVDSQGIVKKSFHDFLPPWLNNLLLDPSRSDTLAYSRLNAIISLGVLGLFNVVIFYFVAIWPRNNLSLEEKTDLALRELESFKHTATGREMIDAAIGAGILFVFLDANGNRIGTIGDPSTSDYDVPITWAENKGTVVENNWYGGYNTSTKSISLNPNNFSYNILSEIIIHEMQHAIDHKTGVIDNEIVDGKNFDEYTDEELANNYSLEEIIKNYERDYLGYLKSEINATDIGIENTHWLTNLIHGRKLNRHDGVYTFEEYNYILSDDEGCRAYNKVYKNQIEEKLRLIYPDGPNYDVTVWMDKDCNLHIDLEELIVNDG